MHTGSSTIQAPAVLVHLDFDIVFPGLAHVKASLDCLEACLLLADISLGFSDSHALLFLNTLNSGNAAQSKLGFLLLMASMPCTYTFHFQLTVAAHTQLMCAVAGVP